VWENIRLYAGIYGMKEKEIVVKMEKVLTDLGFEKARNTLYCHRVSIMVDGKIDALDSPKNLKKQFKVQSMNEVFHKLAREAKRGYTV
jgi:ABC-type multidrug transport system ATPase subunit